MFIDDKIKNFFSMCNDFSNYFYNLQNPGISSGSIPEMIAHLTCTLTSGAKNDELKFRNLNPKRSCGRMCCFPVLK